ncbi:GNAT family N-acetyltransferase [Actinacidiphila guanduensis]|uniref:GNAT family N-acetyltransferase n=1 Tax=Actinacidiphila guanduensis TaxID=310781 RepID=UPI0038993A0F
MPAHSDRTGELAHAQLPARTGPDTAVPLAAATAGGCAVQVVRDSEGFAALGPAWQRLHRRCPQATPFQSHAWLYSWWLSYGRPGRLRVVVVRRGGELVAAAALMRLRRPLPALVALGGAITDYTDVLIDPACADEAADALLRGLRRAARGAVVDLREVRAGAAAETLWRQWPGPRRRAADSLCLELPGVPMAELAARISAQSSSRGQRVRSALRKIEAAGIVERDVPPQEVPGAVDRMLRLHAAQWRGRGVTPEHLRPRFAAHLARACTAMAASGEALLTEFLLDGTPVAANLTLLSPALAGGYLFGADLPALRAAKVDATTLLIRHGAAHASAGGRPVLSLLRGDEPHKSHWRPTPAPNSRLLLSTWPTAPFLLALYGAHRGRARLKSLRDAARSR